MSLLFALVLFAVGLFLIVYFSEKLVEGVVETSLDFGVSAFVVSVVFLGFDPENLAVGVAGSAESLFGIALGSIIGAAMVATALAFGISALLAPMTFEETPRRILVVAPLSVVFAATLAFDGTLSRLDGVLLLSAYGITLGYLCWLGTRGIRIEAGGEVAEVLEEDEEERSRWKSFATLVLSLAAIVAGSEALLEGSETIMAEFGLTDTAFGMTILAFLVSIEELARQLPAALKGRPEITFGTVVGSMLAFFLLNAGIIALVRPVEVGESILNFHLPVALLTLIVISTVVAFGRVSRWMGALLVLVYAVFVAGSYLDWSLSLVG